MRLGVRTPESGSISIYGLSPGKDRNKIREFLGVQLQESAMPPRLKVREAPPYTTIVSMVVSTVVFVFAAVRYFRWE